MSRPGHDLLFKTRRNNKKSQETSYQLLHRTLNPTEQMRSCNDVTAHAYAFCCPARAEREGLTILASDFTRLRGSVAQGPNTIICLSLTTGPFTGPMIISYHAASKSCGNKAVAIPREKKRRLMRLFILH